MRYCLCICLCRSIIEVYLLANKCPIVAELSALSE